MEEKTKTAKHVFLIGSVNCSCIVLNLKRNLIYTLQKLGNIFAKYSLLGGSTLTDPAKMGEKD